MEDKLIEAVESAAAEAVALIRKLDEENAMLRRQLKALCEAVDDYNPGYGDDGGKALYAAREQVKL